MKNNVILNEIYPIAVKNLSNPTNQALVKQTISRYIDRNNEKLTAIGPMSMIPFLDTDRQPIYDAIGMTEKEIKNILSQSKDIKSQWKIMNNPFNAAITCCIKFFMDKNDKEGLNACIIYSTLSAYPTVYSKYFKFEPNVNIMTYTINNLSNKYKIKQLGSLYAALYDTAQICYDNNKSRLGKLTDKDCTFYVQDQRNRINMLIRKIANIFYENKESGKYMNIELENFDDGNYKEANSNIFEVERLANSVVMKLTVQGPDYRFINLAAKYCKVSVNELRNYIKTMVTKEHKEDIKEIVSCILFLYIYESQNTIQEVNSNKFLLYCLDVYKRSNTTDNNIIQIKKILDKWLEDLGTYKKTQRVATINDFRRAIYMFFVVSIQGINQY